MAKSRSVVKDDRLQPLSDQHRVLETKLEALLQGHQSLHDSERQKATSSLRTSMQSLCDTVNHVNKNDKMLIEWHYRSDKVKGVLRLMGVDRRTHILVEKKTAELKKEVQRTERKCDKTRGILGGFAEAAKHLKGEYLVFSTEAVGDLSKEAIQAKRDYDQRGKDLESRVRESEMERYEKEERADSTSKSIRQLEERCDRAKTSQVAWSMGSAGTIACAAATASGFVLFPPLLGATSLYVIGAGMAGYALSYTGHINDLQGQRQELDRQFAALVSSIQELEDKSKNLDLECIDNLEKRQDIQKLQARIETMRSQSQSAVDNLRHNHIKLDKIHLKLRAIVEQLEECQFVETRREMAIKLRGVISSILEDRKKDNFLLKEEKITKLMRSLKMYDENTEEVLRVAAWVLPGHASNGST